MCKVCIGVSDHYASCVTWSKKNIRISRQQHAPVTFRSFKRFNLIAFRSELNLLGLSNVLVLCDPDEVHSFKFFFYQNLHSSCRQIHSFDSASCEIRNRAWVVDKKKTKTKTKKKNNNNTHTHTQKPPNQPWKLNMKILRGKLIWSNTKWYDLKETFSALRQKIIAMVQQCGQQSSHY